MHLWVLGVKRERYRLRDRSEGRDPPNPPRQNRTQRLPKTPSRATTASYTGTEEVERNLLATILSVIEGLKEKPRGSKLQQRGACRRTTGGQEIPDQSHSFLHH
jgi:hypothetical protein